MGYSVKGVLCPNTGFAMASRMGKGGFKRLVALNVRQGNIEKPVFRKAVTACYKRGL